MKNLFADPKSQRNKVNIVQAQKPKIGRPPAMPAKKVNCFKVQNAGEEDMRNMVVGGGGGGLQIQKMGLEFGAQPIERKKSKGVRVRSQMSNAPNTSGNKLKRPPKKIDQNIYENYWDKNERRLKSQERKANNRYGSNKQVDQDQDELEQHE